MTVDRAAILAFDPRSSVPHEITGLGTVYLRSPKVRDVLAFHKLVSELEPGMVDRIRKLETLDRRRIEDVDPEALVAMIETQGVLLAGAMTDAEGCDLFETDREALAFLDRLPPAESMRLIVAVVGIMDESSPKTDDDDDGGDADQDPT